MDQLIRYAFAPTVAEGFGANYTPNQITEPRELAKARRTHSGSWRTS